MDTESFKIKKSLVSCNMKYSTLAAYSNFQHLLIIHPEFEQVQGDIVEFLEEFGVELTHQQKGRITTDIGSRIILSDGDWRNFRGCTFHRVYIHEKIFELPESVKEIISALPYKCVISGHFR